MESLFTSGKHIASAWRRVQDTLPERIVARRKASRAENLCGELTAKIFSTYNTGGNLVRALLFGVALAPYPKVSGVEKVERCFFSSTAQYASPDVDVSGLKQKAYLPSGHLS